MPDGESKAGWEPVLGRGVWEEVVVVLDARAAGFTRVSNARKHLLSGIARCGVCKEPLQLRAESRKRPGAKDGYGCVRPGCRKVQRNVAHLDAYVISAVAGRLGNRANPAGQVPQAPGLAAEFAALAAERAETEAAVKDHGRGRVTLLLARLDSIDARLAELRALAAGDTAARMRATYAGITEEEFLALPLQVRRSLVSACFRVVVRPASKRGPGFRTEDVELIPVG
jgi:hypothetical protein